MTIARNDLEDGEATTTIAIANNNNIFGGENDNDVDNDVVLESSSHEVPRVRWDDISEILLVISWISSVVFYFFGPVVFYFFGPLNSPVTWVLLVMLVVVNGTVGSLLLWQMCQRQRALVAAKEAQQHNNAQTMPDSFIDGVPEASAFAFPDYRRTAPADLHAEEIHYDPSHSVWERPVGKPLCYCDARSFFAAVLSLCWWFVMIRRDEIVFSERWLGWNWRRSPVSVSIGFLLYAVAIQFVTWGLSSFNRKCPSCCCFDPRSTMLFPSVAGIVLLLSIAGVIVSWLRRVDALLDSGTPLYDWETTLLETGSRSVEIGTKIFMYNGPAYVRNVTLDNQTTEEYCHGSDYHDKVIHVDVDVYFGGSWACPALPNAQCETTVQSEVSCDNLVFDIEYVNEGMPLTTPSPKENATDQDYYDAVQRRYHNSDNVNINNNTYDPYGFNDDDAYDPDSYPSRSDWFAFTEVIVGNCGTCEAMSAPSISAATDRGCRATTDAHVFLGATIAACCCLAAYFVPKKK